MKIVLFCHSIVSDWNHGNAHFLRGVATELISRGHEVCVYEARDSWSRTNLLADRGPAATEGFHRAYPLLESRLYDPLSLDLNESLKDADLVLVHEWSDHALVAEIGEHHRRHPGYRLLFHDTHHRCVSDAQSMASYDLRHYDAVLAFGKVIRDRYLREGWIKEAYAWHEAADTRVFHPLPREDFLGDLVWIGNWGDDERTAELEEFLLKPVADLGLKAKVYGVRYPSSALKSLERVGIEYGGSLANFEVPEVFSRYKVTIHVPRRPYVRLLPGIPTIRMFEALACGIPLVSAPWRDSEGLFRPGTDYVVANDGEEMKRHLMQLLSEPEYAKRIALNGLETVLARHTCAHRVDELLDICRALHEREAVALQ